MADPGAHSDGDAQDLVEPGLAERADALVARGLERYGEGDLEGALSEWEHARALVPECAAAEEYIQYVRDNFDLLDEQFQHARDVALAASEAGVPLGSDDQPGGEGDYGYEELEVTSSDALGDALGDVGSEAANTDPAGLDDADTTQGPAVAPRWGEVGKRDSPVGDSLVDDSLVDDGWSLDGFDEQADGRDAGKAELDGGDLDGGDLDGGDLDGGDPDGGGFDDRQAGVPAASPQSEWAGASGAPGTESDEPSLAGGAPPPDAGASVVSTRAESSFDLSSVSSSMLDLDDLPQGYRLRPRGTRSASAARRGNEDEQTVPGGRTPPPLADQPPISQDVLDAIDSVAAELEREQAAGESGNEVRDQADTADFDRNQLRQQLDEASDLHREDTQSPVPVNVTFHDVGTSEKTMPSRPSAERIDFSGLDIGSDGGVNIDDLPSAADLDLGGTASRDDEEPTRERAGVVASWQEFGSPEPASEAASDEEATQQRTFTGSASTSAPELSGEQLDDELLSETASRADLRADLRTDDRHDPDESDDSDDSDDAGRAAGDRGVDLESETRKLVAVQPLGLAAFGGAATRGNVDAIAREFRGELDEGAPTGESDSERVRRRVLALLDQARTELSTDRPMLAAVLAEYAIVEAPDSAVGQKLVHQHRSVVLEVFRSYVGEPTAVPMVTVPMHQVAELDIDSRAAFLLSRIDGTLSFEEILDVCGMPELEAFRHLTRLLVTGILEVR